MGRVSRDARLLFVLLWTIVDDEGRARAAPRMLASLLYPYDDDARTGVCEWLIELERQECILLYVHEGNSYLQIEKWLDHQRIDKPSKSKLPSPSDKPREHSTKPRETSDAEGKGKEGSGKDHLPAEAGPSKPKPYPEDFEKFWKAYPTDSNMSKKEAFGQWRKLSPEKRERAISSIPAFRRYCDENKKWYRIIYAERFLKEEKFEGYASEPELTPEQIAENRDRADRLMRRGKYAGDQAA